MGSRQTGSFSDRSSPSGGFQQLPMGAPQMGAPQMGAPQMGFDDFASGPPPGGMSGSWSTQPPDQNSPFASIAMPKPQFNFPSGNSGQMPQGTGGMPGFMPMGNSIFSPIGQMPQQYQMPSMNPKAGSTCG